MDECIICMETETPELGVLISLDDIKSVKRECNCHALMHPSCYAKWVVDNVSCPICTTTVSFDDNIQSLLPSQPTQDPPNNYYIICIVPFFILIITLISYIYYQLN